MNPILLSFLCGAAFIGGAVATTVLVIFVKSSSAKQDREELFSYWKQSTFNHQQQIDMLARIAISLEQNKKDKP